MDSSSGTVTFLFTDVDGSTKLLHDLGAEQYAAALEVHRRVLEQATLEGPDGSARRRGRAWPNIK